MLLLIDAQALQSVDSQGRGIGRYSWNVLKNLIRLNDKFDIHVLLNKSLYFPEYQELVSLIGQGKIIHWTPSIDGSTTQPRYVSSFFDQEIYSQVVKSINPNVILVLSPFTGVSDTTCFKVVEDFPTLAIFYDAIPYIYKEQYLENRDIKNWYMGQVSELTRCDHIFAISKCSSDDAIKHFEIDSKKISVIETGLEVTEHSAETFEWSYGDKFIISVLGEDARKNKIGLLNAFVILVNRYEYSGRLVIVYKQSEQEERINRKLINDLGLNGKVIFSGYISDEQLATLYVQSETTVFPSFYEGLGLPVLEALSHGAVSVVSSSSSLPELVPIPELQFDPMNPEQMAAAIERSITDAELRERAKSSGKDVVNKYLDDKSVLHILDIASKKAKSTHKNSNELSIIVVTPLPPSKSGIADYSFDLIIALSKFTKITVVTNVGSTSPETVSYLSELKIPTVDIGDSEKINSLSGAFVYNFGNSHFHVQELELYRLKKGVVILHDYYLSGLYWEKNALIQGQISFVSDLKSLEGELSKSELKLLSEPHLAIRQFSMNRSVIEHALGVIVHSEESANRIKDNFWIEQSFALKRVQQIYRESKQPVERLQSDLKTSITIGVFGIVAETKCYREILFAWKEVTKPQNARIVFVGEDLTTDFQTMIFELGLKDSVVLAGRVPDEEYRRWLINVDGAIQLRKFSRGENSRAVLDVLGSGIPTIINSHGTANEYPDEIAITIPDEFSVPELVNAVEELIKFDTNIRKMGEKAADYVAKFHNADACSLEIYEFVKQVQARVIEKPDLLSAFSSVTLSIDEKHAIIESQPPVFSRKRILIDITEFFNSSISSKECEKFELAVEKLKLRNPHFIVEYISNFGASNEFFQSGIHIDNKNRIVPSFKRYLNIVAEDRIISRWPRSILTNNYHQVNNEISLANFIDDVDQLFLELD
jgi:glycosyltransferase involved in cell wall biosynthesis